MSSQTNTTAQFLVGDLVRISARDTPGHETPMYARGKVGRIGSQVRVLVYRVRIGQAALWPAYLGGVGDVVELEVHEVCLEKVEYPAPL